VVRPKYAEFLGAPEAEAYSVVNVEVGERLGDGEDADNA
jgi:hypothetical protein